jgi:pyridoxine 5-phosphate synthase
MTVLLSVNINKLALLRNARGENRPNIMEFVSRSLDAGVRGITVHPRPDGRHIRYSDVEDLSGYLRARHAEFNIEGYPSTEFMEMVLSQKPTQVTLVPDPPEALTSSFGWNVDAHLDALKQHCKRLRQAGIRSSLFIDPGFQSWDALQAISPDRIELFTYDYAHRFHTEPEAALLPYQKAATAAAEFGIEVNAGHDLDLINLPFFIANVPELKEVSIGHALLCDALNLGWETCLERYLHACYRSII